MNLEWSVKAEADLHRLYKFISETYPQAAEKIAEQLVMAAASLPQHPRIGARLTKYSEDEVRKLVIGNYEIRYLASANTVIIIRIWHVREDR